LQMAWRRLPAFRSDMERRSAVVSPIVAVPDARIECYSKAKLGRDVALKLLARLGQPGASPLR
jgi:hypothetical protein